MASPDRKNADESGIDAMIREAIHRDRIDGFKMFARSLPPDHSGIISGTSAQVRSILWALDRLEEHERAAAQVNIPEHIVRQVRDAAAAFDNDVVVVSAPRPVTRDAAEACQAHAVTGLQMPSGNAGHLGDGVFVVVDRNGNPYQVNSEQGTYRALRPAT